MIDRRDFLVGSAAALVGCGATGSRGSAAERFSLGVASGDPTADGFILWTRVQPPPGTPGPIDVDWVVATDPACHDVVAGGRFTAQPRTAWCVHVDVRDLAPGRRYYYRFSTDGDASPVGVTRTLPRASAALQRFRIALTSCQEYSLGYFSAYRDVLAQQPDLVIHNGDYIYESPAGEFRPYPIDGEALSLDDYRQLYATYRSDTDLQAAHAQLPWIVIWDDHEVANDWGPGHFLPSRYNRPQSPDAHRRRVWAARQAFLEHMPLRAALSLHDEQPRVMYGTDIVGDLIEISRLDVRSYRDPPVCNDGSALEFDPCADVIDPQRSLLGRDQEAWLSETFGRSGCRWNCLLQTTVMAPFDRAAGPAVRYESESWDNYAANRSRILEQFRSQRIDNAVSLGGNIHAFYAGTVSDRHGDGECLDPALTEIVTTSISAGGGGTERYDDVHGRRGENPCIDYFENRYRGYTLLDFSPDRIQATLRIVNDITRLPARFSTLARLAIRAGEKGITAMPTPEQSGRNPA